MKPYEILATQMGVIESALRKAKDDGKTTISHDELFGKKESELSHEQKTLRFYAHDYRDMKMSEDSLTEMLEQFAESLNCKHECSSGCRRSGCNCNCGEYHF